MCTHFEQCMKRFDKVDEAFEKLDTRLFKGNGGEPMDIRIDRNTQWRKRLVWAMGFIGTPVVIFIIRVVYLYLTS